MNPKPHAKIMCMNCCDVIQSMYTHDFKYCKCGRIFIDGGTEYLRYGGELEDIVEYYDQ